MSRRARRARRTRSRNIAAAVVATGTFGVLMSYSLVAAPADAPTVPTRVPPSGAAEAAEDNTTDESAKGPSADPTWAVSASPAGAPSAGGTRASEAPQPGSTPTTTTTPTSGPGHKNPPATKKPSASKPSKPKPKPTRPKSVVRKGVEYLLPASKDIPDWAWPIVYRVGERAEPGARVAVALKGDKVTIRTQVPADAPPTGFRLVAFFAAPQDPPIVDVVVTVSNPTDATPEDPASVEVTATNPETGDTSSDTAEIHSPEEADEVTDATLTDVVNDAA